MTSFAEKKEHRRSRLALLMDEIGQGKLSTLTGISEAELYQMSKGKGKSKRNVSDVRARIIEEKSGKGLGWLDAMGDSIRAPANGSGKVIHLALVDRKASNNEAGEPRDEAEGNADLGPDLDPIRMVPIVSLVQGGHDGYFEVMGVIDGEFVPAFTRSVDAYALRVRGDSMRPRIRSGEVIVADPDAGYMPENDVVVKLKNGEYMVKELLIDRADDVVVTSVNNGERRTISKADIEYIHRVIAVMPRDI